MIPHLRILNLRVRCTNCYKPRDVHNTCSAIAGKAERWSALATVPDDGVLGYYGIAEE